MYRIYRLARCPNGETPYHSSYSHQWATCIRGLPRRSTPFSELQDTFGEPLTEGSPGTFCSIRCLQFVYNPVMLGCRDTLRPTSKFLEFRAPLEVEWRYGQLGAGFRLGRSDNKWEFEPALRYYSSDHAWSLELSAWKLGLRHCW